jgi:hypothetical protein
MLDDNGEIVNDNDNVSNEKSHTLAVSLQCRFYYFVRVFAVRYNSSIKKLWMVQ